MAIIPYAVDVPFDRRPVMNWLLVGSVILAFAMQIVVTADGNEEAVEQYVLDGWGVQGIFGYMWLHGGLFHLGGNMLFLWLFGNAVCAKIDNLKYLPVYLLLGLAAATTHLIFDGNPAVGASGAINGIVGMFLIFFWENEVDCLWILFFPYVKKISVSSFWIIGLWLLYDIAGAVMGDQGVAYFAHLGGFFAGIVAAVILLKLNLVTMYRDEESLVQRFEQWFQDRQDSKLEKQARVAVEKAEQSPSRSPIVAKPTSAIVRFWCPCGKEIKAPAKYSGKKGCCPRCQRELIIPQPKLSI